MDPRFRVDKLQPPISLDWLKNSLGAVVCPGHMSAKGITALTTDSRMVEQGDLFIPLTGEKSKGHDFIEDACKRGATFALCEACPNTPSKTTTFLEVNNTNQALLDLAHAWRNQFDIPVAAITGSAGKTTTRNLLSAMIAVNHKPLTSVGNFNNLIGLPLTLLRLRADHTHGVFEIAMNKPREIATLTWCTKPSVRVITNVYPVHLEGVGSFDGVVAAKSEILEDIQPTDFFIMNEDDARLKHLGSKFKSKIIRFSTLEKDVDVSLKSFELTDPKSSRGVVTIAGEDIEFTLPLPGHYNISNFLAAAAAALALGISHDDIVAGAASFAPEAMRNEWLNLSGAVNVFNDCYNANPESMRATFKLFESLPKRNRVAILGDMLELGGDSAKYHEAALHHASRIFDHIWTLGEHFDAATRKLNKGKHITSFTDSFKLVEQCKQGIPNGSDILVKGSRGLHLERVVEALKQQFEEKN